MKKINFLFPIFILLISFFITSHSMRIPPGQTIQITTHFESIIGKPSWLLIVRDMQNAQVLPYLFDIKNNDNFWIAFSYGHSYKITVSKLKFGPYAVINNFCQLEDGILAGKSMFVTLTGKLSPDPHSFNCHVLQYPNPPRMQ